QKLRQTTIGNSGSQSPLPLNLNPTASAKTGAVHLAMRASTTVLLLMVLPLPLFCLLVTLRSFVAVPVEPASNILVSRTIDEADVPRYFSTLGLLHSTAKIAAPTIGAGIASLFGEPASIELSVVLTMLAVISLIVALRRNGEWLGEPAGSTTTKNSASQVPSKPVKLPLAKQPVFRQLIWTVMTYAFMVFMINNQLPILLSGAGFDKALLGILVSCSGAGGILAATYLSRKKTDVAADPMQATVVSVMAIAVCFCALGLAFMLPRAAAEVAAACLFFVTGVFSSVEAIRANVVVVQQFPEEVGLVTGKVGSYQSTAMLVAPWIAAAMLPHVSMSGLFILDGCIGFAVLGAITSAAYRARRRAAAAVAT
ncbi:MAG: MFS transporter, partial [Acidihalobacter sp.]